MIVYRELSSLCSDLELSPKLLYSLSNSIEKHYRKVKIPKKDGARRTLMVPDELLKTVQRRIYERLLLAMPVSFYASSYVPGRGIRRNAQMHVGKPVLLKMDISHFFDSVLYKDVKEKAFPAEIYAENLRVLLTTLCYGVNELPQGAVTSPAISNLILYDFDTKVGNFCREAGISYSRYCDDMSFSGEFEPGEVIRFVTETLRGMGFFVNRRKTVVIRQGQRQTVTGLTVNARLNTPPAYRKKIRQEMYYIRKYGLEDHLQHRKDREQKDRAAYLRGLLGRIGYCLQICPEDEEMKAYRKELTEYDGK